MSARNYSDNSAMQFLLSPFERLGQNIQRSLRRIVNNATGYLNELERRVFRNDQSINELTNEANPVRVFEFEARRDESVGEVITIIDDFDPGFIDWNLILIDDSGVPMTSRLVNVNRSGGPAVHWIYLKNILKKFDPTRNDRMGEESSNTRLYVQGYIRVWTKENPRNRALHNVMMRRIGDITNRRRHELNVGGGDLAPDQDYEVTETADWYIPSNMFCLIKSICKLYEIQTGIEIDANVVVVEFLMLRKIKRNKIYNPMDGHMNVRNIKKVVIIINNLYGLDNDGFGYYKPINKGKYTYYRYLCNNKEVKGYNGPGIWFDKENSHFVVAMNKSVLKRGEKPPIKIIKSKMNQGEELKTKEVKAKRVEDYDLKMAYDLESYEDETVGRQQFVYAAGYVNIEYCLDENMELIDEKECRREMLDSVNIYKNKEEANCINQMIDGMFEELTLCKGKRGCAWAHNGAGFDAYLVLKDLDRSKYSSDEYVKFNGNLLSLTIKELKETEFKRVSMYNTSAESPFRMEDESEEDWCERMFGIWSAGVKSRGGKGEKRTWLTHKSKGETWCNLWMKQYNYDSFKHKSEKVKIQRSITLKCSIKNFVGYVVSLFRWQKDIGMIPYNNGGLMKMEKDITKITKDNYKTDESWVEYLKIDVLGLAYAIQKINTKVIKEVETGKRLR